MWPSGRQWAGRLIRRRGAEFGGEEGPGGGWGGARRKPGPAESILETDLRQGRESPRPEDER